MHILELPNTYCMNLEMNTGKTLKHHKIVLLPLLKSCRLRSNYHQDLCISDAAGFKAKLCAPPIEVGIHRKTTYRTPNPYSRPTQLAGGIFHWQQRPIQVSSFMNCNLRPLQDNYINTLYIYSVRYCISAPSIKRFEMET